MMASFSRLVFILICFSCSLVSYADNLSGPDYSIDAQQKKFQILSGRLFIEGGFCGGICEERVAKLSGTFSATFSKGTHRIYPLITNSKIISSPKFNFQLPAHLDTSSRFPIPLPVSDLVSSVDENTSDVSPFAVTKVISYEFDGQIMRVKGTIEGNPYLANYNTKTYEIKAKVIVPPDLSGYFLITPDMRRCAWPICGGYYISKANHKKMTCSDGQVKERCYVNKMIWHNQTGFENSLRPPSPALVKGVIKHLPWPIWYSTHELSLSTIATLRSADDEADLIIEFPSPSYTMSTLVVQKAYRRSGEVTREFDMTSGIKRNLLAKVSANGVVCITTPCFNFDMSVLNKDIKRSFSDLDTSAIQANEDEMIWLREAIDAREDIIGEGYLADPVKLDHSVPFRNVMWSRKRASDYKGSLIDWPNHGVQYRLLRVYLPIENPIALDEVNILKAVYRKRSRTLWVLAKTTGSNVALTVDGYGLMKYKPRRGYYYLRLRKVQDPGGTVIVKSSAGGSSRLGVTYK